MKTCLNSECWQQNLRNQGKNLGDGSAVSGSKLGMGEQTWKEIGTTVEESWCIGGECSVPLYIPI